VDVPLYDKQQSFPAEIYENAAETHKHYDSLSLAAVSAAGIAFIYPYMSRVDVFGTKFAWARFVFFALLIIAILFLYDRMAKNALTARRVMAWIELSFGQLGFSTNQPRQGYAKDDNFVKKFRSIRVIILVAGIFMVGWLLLTALAVLFGFIETTAPTQPALV
jgi:hypothetical protein